MGSSILWALVTVGQNEMSSGTMSFYLPLAGQSRNVLVAMEKGKKRETENKQVNVTNTFKPHWLKQIPWPSPYSLSEKSHGKG